MAYYPAHLALQWSFSTLGCPELTLEQTAALARRFGVPGIEARAFEGRVDLPDLFAERYGRPEDFASRLRQEGLRLSSMDTSLKLVGNSEADRQEFLDFLPWAEAAGAPRLRVFDGGSVESGMDRDSLAAALETLEWWEKEKRSHGWKAELAIETHDSLTTAAAGHRLIEEAGEAANIIWDTHHTWKKGGASLEESWEALGSRVVHIHVKDSVSKPSARHPFTYTQLGEGEFPLVELFALLERVEYEGDISLEWERKWHPYLPPLETALEKARQLGWWTNGNQPKP